MGAAPARDPRPRLQAPPRSWRSAEYWVRAKERQADFVAAKMFASPGETLSRLQGLYAEFGGDETTASPLVVKGGAAYLVLMEREVGRREASSLPASLRRGPHVADLDFCTRESARGTLHRASRALKWLSRSAPKLPLHFERRWPLWRVRSDASRGEAIFSRERRALGPELDTSLPFKLTYHGGLTDSHSGQEFALVRLGLAVWHTTLRRASLATFVDICVGADVPSVCAMGMRVETPRSVLRTLRRLTFHETRNAPWLAAHGDEGKQGRRMERLVKLSFVVDWRTMGGAQRGEDAAEGLMNRWRRVSRMLYWADEDGLRKLANSAPPQLSFFALCCAGAWREASRGDQVEECAGWVRNLARPAVMELLEED